MQPEFFTKFWKRFLSEAWIIIPKFRSVSLLLCFPSLLQEYKIGKLYGSSQIETVAQLVQSENHIRKKDPNNH
jgi:SNF family Na+-dependent transporter